MEILGYSFFQNALAASFFIAVTCGIAGTYVVARRIVFISGGITHSSFGGLGIGFYLGVNPLLSALVFAALSALGIEYISRSERYKRIREDSVIAAVWSLGMAVGVIFIFLTPDYTPNLSSFLFGNILTVTKTDLLMMGVLTFVIVSVFFLERRLIVYAAFDRDFAITQKLPVRAIEYMMALFIAGTIVISINLVGIMLIMSLLTVPQMTANMFTSDYKKIMITSCILGFLCCISGLFLSYLLNIPSGAFIILVMLVMFLGGKMVRGGWR